MGWLVIAAFAVGSIIAMQPSINAEFGRHAGGQLAAAMNNFVVGIAVLSVVVLVLRAGPDYAKAAKTAPWWAWLGGALGAGFVLSSIALVPRLGAAVFITAMVTGQIVCSLFIDHFGWVGMERRPVTPAKIAGVMIMLVGLFVLRMGDRRVDVLAPPDAPQTPDVVENPGGGG